MRRMETVLSTENFDMANVVITDAGDLELPLCKVEPGTLIIDEDGDIVLLTIDGEDSPNPHAPVFAGICFGSHDYPSSAPFVLYREWYDNHRNDDVEIYRGSISLSN
jgi:hypothetical protein